MDPTFLAFFAASAATVPHISAYLTDIVAILGFCAVLATKLPHPQSKDSFYAGLFSTINFLGQNYGAAAISGVGFADNQAPFLHAPDLVGEPTLLPLHEGT